MSHHSVELARFGRGEVRPRNNAKLYQRRITGNTPWDRFRLDCGIGSVTLASLLSSVAWAAQVA